MIKVEWHGKAVLTTTDEDIARATYVTWVAESKLGDTVEFRDATGEVFASYINYETDSLSAVLGKAFRL